MTELNAADRGRARLIAAFRALDTDGSGYVDLADLVKVLSRLDKLWTEDVINKITDSMCVGEDGRLSIEEFVEWVFTTTECTQHFIDGLQSLEFQPPASEDSEYFGIIEDWLKDRPATMVRFMRHEVDESRLIFDFWGTELQIYLPKHGETAFFLSTSGDDPKLIDMLNEINGLSELNTLPQVLTTLDEMFGDKIIRASSALLRSYSSDQNATVPISAPAPAALMREQSAVVLDLERIVKVQHSLIENYSAQLGISFWCTALLLMQVKWDDNDLVEQFESDPKSLLAEAGAGLPEDVEPIPPPQLCSVCFCDEPNPYLGCGHGLCEDCWPSFLKCNLDSGTVGGDNCLKLKCPGERCPLIVPGLLFEQFLQPDDYERYKRLLALSFVNDNNATVWCPKTGCELCVGFSERRASVTCICGHVFCFSCLADAHEPATCGMSEEWAKNLNKNLSKSERDDQHKKGVKPCPNPNCNTPTYKDDGCHWLKCPRCKEFWCWQCGNWGGGPSGRRPPHHVDVCNEPVNEDWYQKAKASFELTSEESLAQFTWYYKRHVNHLNSLAFAGKLRVSVAELAVEMPEQDKKLIVEAAEVLIECRRMLAWSYVRGYSEEIHRKDTKAFTKLQADVETKTEELSKMVEGDPPLQGMTWLWVALRTDKELTRMVGGSDSTHDVQRNDLVEHLQCLKDNIDTMKQWVSVEPSPKPGDAPAPKAKAKGKAKGKAKAKAKQRPIRHGPVR